MAGAPCRAGRRYANCKVDEASHAQPPRAEWIRRGHPTHAPPATTTSSRKGNKEGKRGKRKGHKGR
eukprot:166629-Chlamydomonas_euryale.AAC.6